MRAPPEDRPVRWRRAFILAALAPGAWGLLHLARLDPWSTERLYTRGVFRGVQWAQSWLHRWWPFSLSELLLALLGLLCACRVVRAARLGARGLRTWRNLAGHATAQLLSAIGVLGLGFQLLWGLNHARPTLAELNGLQVRPVAAAEVQALVEDLHDSAARDRPPGEFPGPSSAEDDALDTAWLRAGELHPHLAGPRTVPRRAAGSRLLTWAGLAGIYSPLTGEPHVNGEMPNVARPFTTCHEIAHQRGVAREDEANFVGWLVCSLSTEPALRYSGSLLALSYALVAWYQEQPEPALAFYASMDPGVRGDLADLWDFWSARRSTMTDLARGANDLFLRGQGQEHGQRSYGRMVDLLVAWRRSEP